MIATIRNLILIVVAMICVTILYVAYGYYELKHRELDMQMELARALSKARPSMQWPEKL
jgi:hypothetical protein